jgi:Transposase C of IS166 homeodomain/Reverse transcriptase (RNA-dependent DNA polymerase)
LTWPTYQADLERNLTDLHERVHRGAYRALPSRRVYIPKPDGRQRPLAVAALEDKIVQRATAAVLNAIYEKDFLGFSYGFRPGRGALQRLLRIRDAELGRARAQALSAEALIAHLRLAIEKMRRELYGQRAERKARLLDQMELELEELEAAAAEDEFAAGKAAATSDNTTAVRAFTRRKPSRKPFPAHLPRERVIVPGPTACACCGSTRLAKLGEDVTETLEMT